MLAQLGGHYSILDHATFFRLIGWEWPKYPDSDSGIGIRIRIDLFFGGGC